MVPAPLLAVQWYEPASDSSTSRIKSVPVTSETRNCAPSVFRVAESLYQVIRDLGCAPSTLHLKNPTCPRGIVRFSGIAAKFPITARVQV